MLGGGVAAGGWAIANWGQVGQIAACWVISPVLGGLIAAGTLYLIKRTITYRQDMLGASPKTVPSLVAFMGWAFTTYLAMKGLKHLWKIDFPTAALLGLVVAAGVFVLMRSYVSRTVPDMPNTKDSVNDLFTIPLIFAAALLSFAHGANDVANAVGPLAGINEAIMSGGVATDAGIPLWVMMVGAVGIALGLALYGPKLIKTVGSEITEIDKTRAFCVAIAAAVTVIVASQLGLPVSSTHIAVGGVFGVGFLREYLKTNYSRKIAEIRAHHANEESPELEAFIARFEEATVEEKTEMLRDMKRAAGPQALYKSERKELRNINRVELVKRTLLLRIAAAWIITVPATAILSAMIYFMLRGLMLP